MAISNINIPDIGGAEDVDVIEIAVKVGDRVAVDDPLVTLESEKASMDIPAPEAGVVKALKMKVGDKVAEGDLILTLETEGSEKPSEEAPEAKKEGEKSPEEAETETSPDSKKETEAAEVKGEEAAEPAEPAETAETAAPRDETVKIPDIGGVDEVDVIEVAVSVGDAIEADAPLITLESEKASMDVPSPFAGVVKALHLKVGDKVKDGDDIVTLTVTEGKAAPEAASSDAAKVDKTSAPAAPAAATKTSEAKPAAAPVSTPDASLPPAGSGGRVHAGPAVRRFARVLGADLSRVKGTGEKGRILREDVEAFVKQAMTQGGAAGGGLPVMPAVDFAKFGEIETQPLSRIKKLTATSVHRSWVLVPHVTQFDQADITELEAFRQKEKDDVAEKGIRLTMLAFLLKATVASLKAFPTFNASLDPSGEQLILKKYFHIGVAVETPQGLVVPVLRKVNEKSVLELAEELGLLSKKARDGKLLPADMQGSCFTISSLGGIGGTAFTPIVNAPNVAILGVSRAAIQPVYQQDKFVPRLMLPLSLSYDHRVIDGAEAARFVRHFVDNLSDMKVSLL